MSFVKERYEHIQTILGNCSQYGCLFLCLCSIAEEVNNRPQDLISAIRLGLSTGLIDNDFYVKDSLTFLNRLTGRVWKRTESDVLPSIIPNNMYTVEKWYNPRTKFTHFRRRGYDTLVNSITVKEGTKTFYLYEHN